MMSGSNKVMGLNSPNKFKNRRTSLNVNLSYVSSTSLLTEDDTTNTSLSLICDINADNNLEKTVVDKPKLPTRRNLSLKRFVPGKQSTSTRNSGDKNTTKVKPSFVKLVRISTSTPLPPRTAGEEEKISEDTFIPSENTKRSSILEDVRFPLDGEIFCPSASIVMETSMDMTEVQGGVIPHSEPVAFPMLEECPAVNRRDDSLGVIQDTDESRYDLEERMEAVIIPDSEQDSINTIRTSLNVNTSLDSRFSSLPNNSIYDPRKISDANFGQDYLAGNRLEDIPSQPTSESSYGTVPTNCVVITRAVIEQENSNDINYQGITNQETTNDLEPRRESPPLPNTVLHDGIQSKNHKSPTEKSPPDDSSSTDSSSSTNQNHQIPSLRMSSDEDETRKAIIKGDLAKKPFRTGKKKLFGLHQSEMVDLSPVTTKIRPEKRAVPKKRVNRRNKTAKKTVNKNDTAKEVPITILTSDDDIELVDPEPRKEKRVRKLKTKKTVIKKKTDLGIQKRMQENADIMNETCDDISSALGRTSLDDFEPKNKFVRQKIRRIRPKIIIVATGLSIEQKLLVKSTVTILGSAKLDKIVTRNTTHVVSKGTRTVNLLRGMVRGCWLVSFEWISKSLEAGRWVDPEEYEITGFSKAVQENRKEKQLFGAAYVSELFLTCGLIHIKEETSTPAPVLKELVRIAGGRVAKEPEDAKIIIGRGGFKEIWILDSITNGEVQPLEQYCKKKCSD